MEYIINCNRADANSIIDQEKYSWMRNILLQMGFDWEDSLPEEKSSLTINQKAKFRKFLEINSIYINDLDGTMNIYLDKEKIAEWTKPFYKLVVDPKEIDPKKRLYYSIVINCNSCFDIEEEEENV